MRTLISRCFCDRDARCRAGSAVGLALLLAVVIYGRIVSSGGPAPVRIVVYAFSTQEEVMLQSIFPGFKEAWKAETGQELIIEGVFGPSETLAGQINLGAPADVALFSNAQHVTHLKVGRRVRVDSESVVVSQTPMVIVTRPGNPRNITSYSDLTQPGLRLLHADPRSSGAGQWALLAEYGSTLHLTGDPSKAELQLSAIWQNVKLLGASARTTMTLFELGAGDAFVTYEHDALLAVERGTPLEIVLPASTIVARHVAVIVDDNVTPDELPAARAFLDYLVGDAGQRAFSRYHLRSPDPAVGEVPELSQVITVDDLGGWSQAYSRLVEGLWETQIEPLLHLDEPPGLPGTGE